IESALGNLGLALLLGGVLILLVLGAFFQNWRMALISALAVSLCLVAAGVVLHLRGATMNVVLLAGLLIAVGSVVDDAVISAENIARRLRQHRGVRSDWSTARI